MSVDSCTVLYIVRILGKGVVHIAEENLGGERGASELNGASFQREARGREGTGRREIPSPPSPSLEEFSVRKTREMLLP